MLIFNTLPFVKTKNKLELPNFQCFLNAGETVIFTGVGDPTPSEAVGDNPNAGETVILAGVGDLHDVFRVTTPSEESQILI